MRRIAVLALIWGWSFLFIKVAVAGMTPVTVAGARIALGAVVMVAYVRARRTPLPRDRATWAHFAVMGVIHSALPFSLLAWGEERITSALTAVLNASTSLFAAVLTALFLGERLRRPQRVGLGLGFAGVVVAAGVGTADLTGSSLSGSAAAVAASACYGLGFVYAQARLSAVPPVVAATGQLIAGTLIIAPFAVATSLQRGLDLAPHRVAAVVTLGVMGTGWAYVLNYRSIAEVGPTAASLVTQLVPVVAVAAGVLFLGEPFRLRLIAGGALTVVGIALVHDRIGRLRPAPPAIPPEPVDPTGPPGPVPAPEPRTGA